MNKIAIAVIVGIAVWLVALLLGTLLLAVDAQPVTAVGAFLKTYAALIGLLAGLLNYFTGRPSF